MPKCPRPECGHEWVSKPIVCPNLIATNAKKTFRSNIKRSAITFAQIENYVKKKPKGFQIRTSDLIDLYDLENKTNGDLMRRTLDWLVCRGVLEKTKFGNGSKGHIYKVVFGTKCQYNEMGSKGYTCLFDWSQAKQLDVSFKEEDEK